MVLWILTIHFLRKKPSISQIALIQPVKQQAIILCVHITILTVFLHLLRTAQITMVHTNFPEKLIPLMIFKALRDEKLPVYGDGKNVRDWIHVLDHCKAIDTVISKGKIGEIYH